MTNDKAVQTTEARARAAANGRHLIKHYDGRVSSVWRYADADAAQRAVVREQAWLDKFRKQYEDDGLTPPARPWKFEVI